MVVRPMTMEIRCFKVSSFKNIAINKLLKLQYISSYRRRGKKEGKKCFACFFSSFTRLQATQFLFFRRKIVNTLIKNKLVRRWTFDLDMLSARGQPASCRARPTDVNGGLEYITWIHGLGGKSLPAASYALLSNLFFLFFLPSECCLLFSAHPRPNAFLSNT